LQVLAVVHCHSLDATYSSWEGQNGHTSAAWRAILAKVNTYADLEPSLLGRVEEIIDFVTA
jgi:hypothetical protein